VCVFMCECAFVIVCVYVCVFAKQLGHSPFVELVLFIKYFVYEATLQLTVSVGYASGAGSSVKTLEIIHAKKSFLFST